MSEYYTNYAKRDPFEFMPETYNVTTDKDMSNNHVLSKLDSESIWIVKPGENSNRGRGIRIFTYNQKIMRFLE